MQISDCEWIIIRNYPERPVALVRRFEATAEHPSYFRVVTWRPTGAGRVLVGRYESLRDADRAVPFLDQKGQPTSATPALNWTKGRSVRGTLAT